VKYGVAWDGNLPSNSAKDMMALPLFDVEGRECYGTLSMVFISCLFHPNPSNIGEICPQTQFVIFNIHVVALITIKTCQMIKLNFTRS